MSGTGPTPAEQHLGDRLAALVDGELKHDARERVLAHLATCAKCKAEAAAQRRLKSVFAQSAPPSPSEGFLARLQGLPGGPGGGDDGRGGPFGGSGRFADGFLPVIQPPGSRTDARIGPGPGDPALGDFGCLPTSHGSTAVFPRGSAGMDFRQPDGSPARGGFRIHEVGREPDRAAWRGRRFAFAAAGAVSLAAIALGGALQTASGPTAPARAAGGGNTVTPLDAGRGENPGSVGRRNGNGRNTPAAAETHGSAGAVTTPPSVTDTTPLVSYTAPALATGNLSDLSGLAGLSGLSGNNLDVRLLTDASAPPLIRPTDATPLLARVLGRLTPSSAAPSVPSSWTPPSPSVLPTPADQRLPLSSRR
ncbi:zf-HC2 domain-containing protein [Streptomyces sp. NPDC014734]|uniref:zf-HC2 domain-containing protein n=1 Tax=Streptomyces sp. NPDC014734 TaxID=3364886 RepID=UPI003702188A